MVSLGRDAPSWELNRWGGDALRFAPFDGGGYSLRGNKWNVQYSGKKQSHRFTILDNERFEYDIILNTEPESNRLYLAIEGWEGFDFFRQPDTFGPAILRGSYAVYKKEGAINSPARPVGTGKICHIHRPQIIDARGRRVWGDVRIRAGVMTLTIPEEWLGAARYPVVVDPIIGSNTAGAYNTYPHREEDGYANDWPIEIYDSLALNKCRIPMDLLGTYNTYAYIDSVFETYDCLILPLLYSEYANRPGYLLNYNCTPGYPLGTSRNLNAYAPKWVKTTLSMNKLSANNTDVWFGIYGRGVIPRFDYGAPFYQIQDMQIYTEWINESNSMRECLEENFFDDVSDYTDEFQDPDDWKWNYHPGARYDLKVSMYLDMPAAYARTLTQGVRFADIRKSAGAYKRMTAQTVKGTAALRRFESFFRSCAMKVRAGMSLSRAPVFVRKAIEQLQTVMGTGAQRKLNRIMAHYTAAQDAASRKGDSRRNIGNAIVAGDYATFSVAWLRRLPERGGALDHIRHIGGYIRGLYVAAGSLAETGHAGAYHRKQADTANSQGVSLRHLFIFLRLATVSFVRDFLLRRFLIANETVVLKSPVCREIVIDSKIH